MFVDDSALPAPQIPARQPDPLDLDAPDFFQGLSAAFSAEQIRTDAWSRAAKTEAGVYEELRGRLEQELGVDEVQSIIDQVMPRRTPHPERYERNALLSMASELGLKDVPVTAEGVAEEARRRSMAEYQDAMSTLDYMKAGRGLANFLGAGAAAITDPTSIALMFVSGGTGSVTRIIAREALLGAVGEALVLPRQYEMAEYLKIEDPNALAQIGLGAAFAGALAGGAKALTRGGRAAISAEMSRALEYARTRNSTIPVEGRANPLDATALIDAAEDALATGRPLPRATPTRTADLPEPDDLTIQPEPFTRTNGQPFKTATALRTEMKRRGVDPEAYDELEALGGFIARPKAAPTPEAPPAQATTTPPPEAAPAPAQALVEATQRNAPDQSPARAAAMENPTSWVLRDKATGRAVAETSDEAKVRALNTAKYEAVPAQQHLEELNTEGTLAYQAARQTEAEAPPPTPASRAPAAQGAAAPDAVTAVDDASEDITTPEARRMTDRAIQAIRDEVEENGDATLEIDGQRVLLSDVLRDIDEFEDIVAVVEVCEMGARR